MRTIPLIIAAAALLALAACTQPATPPNQHASPTVAYTTYGGFIMPDSAITTTTIVGRNATAVTTSSNGTVTRQVSYTTSQAKADALAAAVDASRFPELPARIPRPQNTSVADVGSANLTISKNGQTQTVVIELNWPGAMPHDLSSIVSAIQNITQDEPQPSQGGPVGGVMLRPIEYAPKQCVTTPWDSWYANGSVQFVAKPTTAQLVTAYYGSQGIELANVERVNRTEMVCEACGVCDAPYYVTASIANADVARIEAAGWTLQTPTGSNASPQTS